LAPQGDTLPAFAQSGSRRFGQRDCQRSAGGGRLATGPLILASAVLLIWR